MAVSKDVTHRLGPDMPDDEELRDGQGRVIERGTSEPPFVLIHQR